MGNGRQSPRSAPVRASRLRRLVSNRLAQPCQSPRGRILAPCLTVRQTPPSWLATETPDTHSSCPSPSQFAAASPQHRLGQRTSYISHLSNLNNQAYYTVR